MTASMTNQKTALIDLSSTLFLSLDESHFFTSLNKFFMNHMNAHNVLVYKLLDNGSAQRMAHNGQAVEARSLSRGIANATLAVGCGLGAQTRSAPCQSPHPNRRISNQRSVPRRAPMRR